MLVSTGLTGVDAAAEQPLLLEVHVNGRPSAQIGEFILSDGRLSARRSELRELGMTFPDPQTPGQNDLVALSGLRGLAFRLDLPRQAIYLTVDDALLTPSVLHAGAEASRSGDVQSGTGLALDYDLTGSMAGGRASAAGRVDVRAFSPWGIGSSGFLIYANSDSNGSGGVAATSVIRLDTSYTFSDATTLHRIRVGDFISGGLSWTRPVRMAGVQFSIDYALRPDLVTFPLPSVSGSAAVPSTIDVLVNGTRLFSREIEAGPFTVPQLPVVTGAGTISTTLTNALGRQVSTTLPFYATSLLLAPGLQSASVQAGALRRNFGLRSDDYRRMAASFTYRRGLSDRLTIEASGEGTAKVAMGGGGAVLNIDNFAVVNAAAAASGSPAGVGSQVTIGIQRAGRKLNLSGSATVASARFRDLAADDGDASPRLQINANAGWTLGRFGAIGVAFVGIKRDALSARDVVGPVKTAFMQAPVSMESLMFLQPAQKAYVASASYSVQVKRISLFATGFRDFAGIGGSGALLGIAMPLGRRSSVSIDSSISNGSRMLQGQATQSAVAIGDWGYQVVASPASPQRAFGEIRYKAPFAALAAGADYSSKQTTFRLEAQGSVSMLDGSVFASNTIYDSFAVVDTSGLAGVHVRNENRDVGTTDRHGRLLVPELRSFDLNHLSIEPNDVPLDSDLDTAGRLVRPQDRSGVVVRFPVKPSNAALLRMVAADGNPIPIGSTARLANGEAVPVGYDGEAFLPGLSARNDVQVERADGGRCVVHFEYAPVVGQVPVIGPLRCIAQTP
ncbi:fimbria/pilus outer membrane usher protein (plasmid) [Polymorphobacter sp. PAMC 29334]|nr:fimbria/pilus outer membrane usher protein [Polymorphobacter sp. PAMC 29334]